MKPFTDRLAVVTASVDPKIATECLESWRDTATYQWPLYVGVNHPPVGVVPAFANICHEALRDSPELIVALHDDVLIEQPDWDAMVLEWFDHRPACYLAGFGGGTGLGAADIYQVPYDPMQLARVDFISNMRDAEAHGRRVTVPTRIACTDGFSIIGRAAWLTESWQYLARLGMVHHFFDSAFGALCARAKKEAWLLPVRAHHYGGRTAVANAAYQQWATTRPEGSDHGFWEKSHQLGYDEFRDVLPVRIEDARL